MIGHMAASVGVKWSEHIPGCSGKADAREQG